MNLFNRGPETVGRAKHSQLDGVKTAGKYVGLASGVAALAGLAHVVLGANSQPSYQGQFIERDTGHVVLYNGADTSIPGNICLEYAIEKIPGQPDNDLSGRCFSAEQIKGLTGAQIQVPPVRYQ